MRVFLIHGMGRTTTSMASLARDLRTQGHDTTLHGYSVLLHTLDDIADRFVATVAEVAGGERYAVVGHSLGNIITRMASPRLLGLSRFVMLAPPNKPPAAARMLSDSALLNPFFAAFCRDAAKKLTSATFYAQLPVPAVPTLIIAGTRGPRAQVFPWRGAKSDGVVGVDETRIDAAGHVDMTHIEVAALHTFVMNHPEVRAHVGRFLAEGAGDVGDLRSTPRSAQESSTEEETRPP